MNPRLCVGVNIVNIRLYEKVVNPRFPPGPLYLTSLLSWAEIKTPALLKLVGEILLFNPFCWLYVVQYE
jgi:hypothetical protein